MTDVQDQSSMETDDFKLWFSRRLTEQEWKAIQQRESEAFGEEKFRYEKDKLIALVKEIAPDVEVVNELRYLNPQEFQEGGYLQEVNRRFLHPLGLALSIETPKGPQGRYRFGPIWDCRDDPEGIYFYHSVDLIEKADRIREQEAERRAPRVAKLGYWLQPVISEPQDDDKEKKA